MHPLQGGQSRAVGHQGGQTCQLQAQGTHEGPGSPTQRCVTMTYRKHERKKGEGPGWGHLSPEPAKTLLSWGRGPPFPTEGARHVTLSASPLTSNCPGTVHAQRPRGPSETPSSRCMRAGATAPASAQHRATPLRAPRLMPSWPHTFTC